MNLLRHANSCNALPLFRTKWFSSIPLSYGPLQSDYMKKRFQSIKAKSPNIEINSLSKSLHNNSQLDILRRCSSSQQMIFKQKGLLNDLRNSIDPYVRLARFDRPIGKLS